MSLLPDWKIEEYIKSGKIVVKPFDPSLIGPASLDIRLGNRFRVFKSENLEVIDPFTFREEKLTEIVEEDRKIEIYKHSEVVVIEDGYFVLHPNEFVLASIYEYIELPPFIAAQLNGRSSIARLGIVVHTSAGWVDPGYRGHLTLELINVNNVPVKLRPGMKVAQLTFFELEKVRTPYNVRPGSKYVDEPGATESRFSFDNKKE